MTSNVDRITIENNTIIGYKFVEEKEYKNIIIPLIDLSNGLQQITISNEALNDLIATLNNSIKLR